MINYSIVMRSVNANLFEINQAKSRIKAAQAAGQTPAQTDLDLVATEKQNAYAIAQYADVMTIEKFARHISSHGCVYSRADISAILYMAVDCMRELLLEGKKIRLGDLGDFSVSLSSKGAETADKFTAQNITDVNVVWDCGQEFKNLIADAEFNLVASRSVQAAVLKAIKNGETVVDLSKSETEDNNPNGGGDSGGDDNGSGSGSGNQGGDQTPKKSVNLTVSPAGAGTVTGGGQYDSGASVNIGATPASGYHFVKWNDNSTSATRTLNVLDSDIDLMAIFEADVPDDDDEENPGGGNEGGDGPANY